MTTGLITFPCLCRSLRSAETDHLPPGLPIQLIRSVEDKEDQVQDLG